LSTLHTNSAAGAIPRLIDMGAEPFLLTSTINVIIAQRLVRKLSDSKEAYKLTEAELKDLEGYVNLDLVLEALKKEKIVEKNVTWKTVEFFKPRKTSTTADGYGGRLGIYEIFGVSTAIQKLINERATSDEINTQARGEGMLTMVEDGIFKAVQGLTSIEEVFRVANN
ncbi:MAG TPA: ATPase, T2SS/T4P/T4SS family, partial [Candidatus Paceibacterota bacterium]